jgi:hypothetical protein
MYMWDHLMTITAGPRAPITRTKAPRKNNMMAVSCPQYLRLGDLTPVATEGEKHVFLSIYVVYVFLEV